MQPDAHDSLYVHEKMCSWSFSKTKLVSFLYSETMNQFVIYFFVAGFATLVDWVSFYCLVHTQLYYQGSLIISFTLGTVTHYVFNKIFTFKNKCKKTLNQFGTFLTIAVVYLFLTMAIMYILVDVLNIWEVQSRIVTTFILFGFSFASHKYITFNKKYFGD